MATNKDDEYYQKLLNAATCSKKDEKVKTSSLILGAFVRQGGPPPPGRILGGPPPPGEEEGELQEHPAAPAVVEHEVSEEELRKFKDFIKSDNTSPLIATEINSNDDEELKKAIILFKDMQRGQKQAVKRYLMEKYNEKHPGANRSSRLGKKGGSNHRDRRKNKTLKGKNCKQYKKFDNKSKTNKRRK